MKKFLSVMMVLFFMMAMVSCKSSLEQRARRCIKEMKAIAYSFNDIENSKTNIDEKVAVDMMWSLVFFGAAVNSFDKHPENPGDLDLLLLLEYPEEFFYNLFNKNKYNLEDINFDVVEEWINESKERLQRVKDLLSLYDIEHRILKVV